jgi:hypothetical protein
MNAFDSVVFTIKSYFYGIHADCNVEEDGIIIVDLLHSNINYIMRSLLIAAYLGKITGRRLVGLTGRPGVVNRSCGEVDWQVNRSLARAFGVSDFWDIVTADEGCRPQALALLDEVERGLPEMSDNGFRRALLAARRTDGFPVGRFIYDTVVRAELCATVRPFDPRVVVRATDTVHLELWFRDQLSRFCAKPPLFVTGHIDYNPWGVIAELVRQCGGDIFYFTNDTAFSVYRIGEDLRGEPCLQGAIAAVNRIWFSQTVQPLASAWTGEVARFQTLKRLRRFNENWTTRLHADPPPALSALAAGSLKKLRGWESDIPVVFIFAHALADQPVGSDTIYDDRYQWLMATIAFAAAHKERNWIVKIHPSDPSYDLSGAAQSLIARYEHLPHLWFISEPMAMSVMVNLADVATTIVGTPGLQFAASGKAVICAGDGRYSRCGFVHRPTTEADYFALLLSEPALLAPTPEQTELAQLFEYASLVRCAHYSAILTNEFDQQADEAYWAALDRRLRHHLVGRDELFQSLRRMVEDGEQRFAPRDLSPLAIGPDARHTGDELVLSVETPLDFSCDGRGCAGLIAGFHERESWGVWTASSSATLTFFIRAPADWRSATLLVEATRLLDEDFGIEYQGEALKLKSLDNASLCELPLSTPNSDELHAIAITLRCELLVPCEIGVGEDKRKLGLALKRISLLYGSGSTQVARPSAPEEDEPHAQA